MNRRGALEAFPFIPAIGLGPIAGARLIPSLLLLTFLAACTEAEVVAVAEAPRAVRTTVAEMAAPTRTRSFPAVLEPPEITALAFDVGGRLGEIDLRVGQEVSEGEVIATVEAADAELRIRQAEAALGEARIAADNARASADRQQTLLRRGVVAAAARDAAVTTAEQADARVEQSERSLELLRGSLADTSLRAPVNAIVNSIEVEAFGSVQPGQPVVTLYRDVELQATIPVSYDVVARLALGMEVAVRPADGDPTPLPASVSEIARRAPAVSSFPVVVSLDAGRADLRSGMAVEVLIELPVPEAERGIALPLSALALDRPADMEAQPRRADVYVVEIEDDAAHVEPRTVAIGAVVGDRTFVVRGLAPGEHIVTAGVPFLYVGQTVAVPDTAAPREEPSRDLALEPDPSSPTPVPDVDTNLVALIADDVPPADGNASMGDASTRDASAPVVPMRRQGTELPASAPTDAARRSDGTVEPGEGHTDEGSEPVLVPLGEAVRIEPVAAPTGPADATSALPAVAVETVSIAPVQELAAGGTKQTTIDPFDTAAVQSALDALGYDPGPVDGVMGPRTRTALRAFQSAEGLSTEGFEASGEVDDATARALRAATRSTGPRSGP